MPLRFLMVLLVLSVMINYVDRAGISIAAPVLSSELGLSPVQMGLLFSAFFWSYIGVMIIAGWLCDTYGIRWVLGAGFFIWSLATLSTGLAKTFVALLALRLILGMGESVAYPAYSRIIAGRFSIENRGLPNGFIDAGSRIGTGLGILLGGLALARFGWRALFVILGMVSMAWLIPWSIGAPRESGNNPTSRQGGPTILQVLGCRDAWGAFLGNFSGSYGYYFLITWLPYYLVEERHVSLQKMAVVGSIPYLASATGLILGGWTSDRWIRSGASPTSVRKTFVAGGLLLTTLMFPAATARNLTECIVLLMGAYFAVGLYSSNHWAIAQTLAGPVAAGRWTGMQNTVSNFAGIIGPYATGWIVAKTRSFFLGFLLASIIAVLGASSYLFVVRKVQPVLWEKRGEVAP
jgi:MFS transporter, ACS family, D-galactonate transporter